MSLIRVLAGAMALALAASLALPAAAQQGGVEVVLQLAGSSTSVRDQPYGSIVTSVAISPDGQRLAAGDMSGTLRLWNVADGSLLRTFQLPANVSAVAFLFDNRRLVAVSRRIHVFDAETGRLIQAFENGLPEFVAAVLSPNGKRVVSAGTETNFTEWDVISAEQAHTYSADASAGPVGLIAYSPDGQQILTMHQDSTLRLWDSQSNEQVRTFDVGDRSPTAVAFSPDGKRVFALANAELLMFDTATAKLIRATTFDNSAISTAMRAVGDQVLVCDRGVLAVIDPAEGKVVRTVKLTEERVTANAFSRDAKQIVTVSDTGTLRVSDAESGKLVRELNAPYAATITVAQFSPDGKQLFVGENGKRIQQWDLATPRFVRAFESSAEVARVLSASPDGSRLLAGDGWAAGLIDTATGRVVRTFEPAEKQPMSASLSPDGKIVFAAGPKDGQASFYDAATGNLIRTLDSDFKDAGRGVFSPDSRRIAVAGYTEPVKLWDVATGNLIRPFPGSEQGGTVMAFTADGRTLVLSGPDAMAALWDVETGKRLVATPFPLGEGYVVSQDAKRLLSTSTEATNLVDLTNGQLIVSLPGSIPFDTPALFLPDSQSFLVGGYERAATLRDVATGGVIRELAGHFGPVIAMALTADGKRVVTGGPDTTLKVWDIASGALLATLVSAGEGEWVILTPEGFFAASPKGANYLRLVSGYDAAPVESAKALQRPDFVAEKIAGDPRGLVRDAAAKLDLAGLFAAARKAR